MVDELLKLGEEPSQDSYQQDYAQAQFHQEVPNELKRTIEDIARRNWKFHDHQFGDFSQFLQAVAKNWLDRRDVFVEMGLANGFESVTEIPPGLPKERVSVLLLSRNGSYVMATKGTLTTTGGGFLYKKITLRKLEKGIPSNLSETSGARFLDMPRVGHRPRILPRGARHALEPSPIWVMGVKVVEDNLPQEIELSELEDLSISMLKEMSTISTIELSEP